MFYSVDKSFNTPPKKAQVGAALITMLIVVLIVTMVATRLQTDFYKSVVGANSAVAYYQSQYLLDSLPDIAQLALEADSTDSYDALTDVWAVEQPAMPVPGGVLAARIVDGQSRFNLNALATPPQQGENFSEPQRMFVRLLQAIPDAQIDAMAAQQITSAVIDWIDDDQMVTGAQGAEDNYYVSQAGYRAANKRMISVSELKLIRHITLEQYHFIKPYLVALPSDQLALNVNTASLPLLRSINLGSQLSPLAIDQAEQWLQLREQTPFESIGSFDQSPTYRQLATAGAVDRGNLLVTADWLQIEADLQIEGRWFFATAIAERNGKELTVKHFAKGEL